MNCSECQNQIFDGEINQEAAVHLKECEDCRALDREVRLNLAALAELREEVIPVRAAARPRPWTWAVAVAAAAAIIAAIAWPNPPAPIPAAPVAQIEPPPATPALPEIVPETVVAIAPPRVPSVRRPAPPPKPEVPQEPLLVKFFTDDPEVVIYWLIDPPTGDLNL